MVTQNWNEREVEAGQPLPFHIHEQDRAMIRDAIIDAVVHAPDLLRWSISWFPVLFKIFTWFCEAFLRCYFDCKYLFDNAIVKQLNKLPKYVKLKLTSNEMDYSYSN